MTFIELFSGSTCIHTSLLTKDETVKRTQNLKKYDELKLDFCFLHSIKYSGGILN